MLTRRMVTASPFAQFQREMDGLFHGFFGANGSPSAGAFPALNVWETPEGYRVEAELPGLKLNELELVVHQRELTIKGEYKPAFGEQDTVHRRERPLGPFSRTVRFPADLDAGQARAELKDGVLSVVLPRLASSQPRKIEIRSIE
ncbi:MAG: hypothetical protein AMXMBFR7_38570 [Planctomycetota bacterium]